MQTGKITIRNNDIESLQKYLIKQFGFSYQNISDDCVVIMRENNRILEESYEANIIILKKVENKILAEIFSGGGRLRAPETILDPEIDFILNARQEIINYICKMGFTAE